MVLQGSKNPRSEFLNWTYYQAIPNPVGSAVVDLCYCFIPLDSNLHFPQRRLIELRMEHAELNASIDRTGSELQMDELLLRRLKKQRLSLRDEISRLEVGLLPDETA